jgi:1-deoxy-D-xylulose-5-phosphate reductoisomerase
MTETQSSHDPSHDNSADSARPIQNVAVLGATGSIGLATVDVLKNLKRIDRRTHWNLRVVSGHHNVGRLAEIAGDPVLPAQRVVVSDPKSGGRFPTAGADLRIGPEYLIEAAEDDEVDVVVAAIVGRAGLESTLAAADAGKRVALANKETLVVAGPLVNAATRQSGAQLLPVDSEHSAIFQCIGTSTSPPKRVILTASGGPFRTWTSEQMHEATPESALAHPTWDMGPKITIDSATMMNKSLEIIEARWLFGVSAEQIEVVVHPQSIIHSLVEFEDGSLIAQLSPPDMRLPIQYALTYPRRLPCEAPPLSRNKTWDLTLQPADRERFPALELGFEVAAVGGTAGAVVNAANEEAVGLFLSRQIRFTDIVPSCRRVLESHTYEPNPPLGRLLELDRWARREVRKCCGISK